LNQIFNELGTKLKVLENRIFTQGENSINIDLINLKPGVYFLRVISGKNIITKRFVKI